MNVKAVRLFAALAVCVAAVSPAWADDPAVTLASGGGLMLGDLQCPHGPPEVARPPSTPHPAPLNEQIPTRDELGAMADFRPAQPPVLDLSKAPAFALQDAGASAPRPRRIAFWGDSHIAAGPFMGQLQGAIRDHSETVGTRFLPPTMGRANVRLPTLHGYCMGTGWSTALSYKETDVQAVGPALANRIASAGSESYLWLDLRTSFRVANVRDLEIVYRPAGDTEIAVSINDGPEQPVTLAPSATRGSGFLMLNADGPIGTVKMRVTRGTLVLQGFLLDYKDAPLVTFDVFGLPSSTARGWSNADPAAIASALHGETYDAIGLEYGTNEGSDLKFDRDKYAANLTRTLTNMRTVFPQASCVLVGPPDRGILVNRHGRTGDLDLLLYARIHQQIAQVQAQVGAQFNCVAWSWQDYMGGPGGNYGWAYNDPVLMGHDLTHMTMEGYRRTGQALAHSLGWVGDLYPK
jgi:lysophospholipase L1-like esterase